MRITDMPTLISSVESRGRGTRSFETEIRKRHREIDRARESSGNVNARHESGAIVLGFDRDS